MNKIFKAIISFILCFSLFSSIYIVKAEEVSTEENTVQNEENNNEIINEDSNEDFTFEDIQNQIKENNFVQWVVLLMTAFLGSGAFYMLLKALANKALSKIKEKLNKELDEAKITKEIYEKRLATLIDLQEKTEATLKDCNEKINNMCKMLEEDFAITEEQKQKAREQLELIFGGDYEKTDIR